MNNAKRILFFLLLLTSSAGAQYVSIPDAAFRNRLQIMYPSCFSGNLMDTTCAGIVNAHTLILSGVGIQDITGIQYFDSLYWLDIKNNYCTFIPQLPPLLRHLDFNNNDVTSLLMLPTLLDFLDCSENQLTSLPTLPNNLLTLYCGNNQISTLPSLPLSLHIFWCNSNGLTFLPALPASLQELLIDRNLLTILTTIPDSIKWLSVSFNSFTSVPTLPDSLQTLWVDNNPITSLPALPNSLEALYAYNTQLTSLPDLPDSLYVLALDGSTTSCLPEIKKIDYLSWANTNIHCLPNIGQVYHSTPQILTLPLCLPSDGCPMYWNISGKVFYDNNGNCIQDVNDSSLFNIPVSLDSGAAHLQTCLTDERGLYSFGPGLGNYTLYVDTTNLPFNVICPPSFYNTSNLIPTDSVDTIVNFSLQCKSGFDLEARDVSPNIPFRPSSMRILNVRAGDAASMYNFHCTTVSGTVELILDNLVSYSSALGLAPSIINGDTIRWDIPDFSIVNPFTDFNIQVLVSAFATSSDSICTRLNIYPALDNVPSNNTIYSCYPIVNSHDPNEKYMEPSGIVDTSNQWFTFTVFFQNTGNAPAEQIYIIDTLDADLDLTTFTYQSSSHYVIPQLLPNRILRFNFPNINLPDSTNDEPNSHGYVQYKIKRQSGLPLNTVITNTAYIYFDFNTPVVTNTVSATLSTTTGVITSYEISDKLKINPNPTRQQLNVECSIPNAELKIYDLMGSEVYTIKLSAVHQTLNLNLSPAVYFVKVGNQCQKLVIE